MELELRSEGLQGVHKPGGCVGEPPGFVAPGLAPSGIFSASVFYIPEIFSVNFQVNPRTFISAKK